MFGQQVEDAARQHAISSFPNESCGLVVANKFVPVQNIADDPVHHFQMPDDTWTKFGKVQAVIHSHTTPTFQLTPSSYDMYHQISTDVPWGLTQSDGIGASPVLWWGDFRLDEELLGREFIHGVNDCYGAIRSWYWQKLKIKLMDIPRDAQWWEHGLDIYTTSFEKVGFVEIEEEEAKVGDLALINFRSSVPNHGGVLVEDGLLYHHLQNRLSCREPIGRWKQLITKWLRYEGL